MLWHIPLRHHVTASTVAQGNVFTFHPPAVTYFYRLFWLFQQQVYEVKLEDGNVYVKHASRLSLQPFPVDQKNWKTSEAALSSSPWWELQFPDCGVSCLQWAYLGYF